MSHRERAWLVIRVVIAVVATAGGYVGTFVAPLPKSWPAQATFGVVVATILGLFAYAEYKRQAEGAIADSEHRDRLHGEAASLHRLVGQSEAVPEPTLWFRLHFKADAEALAVWNQRCAALRDARKNLDKHLPIHGPADLPISIVLGQVKLSEVDWYAYEASEGDVAVIAMWREYTSPILHSLEGEDAATALERYSGALNAVENCRCVGTWRSARDEVVAQRGQLLDSLHLIGDSFKIRRAPGCVPCRPFKT